MRFQLCEHGPVDAGVEDLSRGGEYVEARELPSDERDAAWAQIAALAR
jgi:hypothetical protein